MLIFQEMLRLPEDLRILSYRNERASRSPTKRRPRKPATTENCRLKASIIAISSEHTVAVYIPYLSSTSLTFPNSAVIERGLSLMYRPLRPHQGIPCREDGQRNIQDSHNTTPDTRARLISEPLRSKHRTLLAYSMCDLAVLTARSLSFVKNRHCIREE